MIIAEISVVPIGEGTSVSRYVKAAIEMLKRTELKVIPNPMGTVLEAKNIDSLLLGVKKAHEAVFKLGAKRVLTTIKIDERRDKKVTADNKMKAIGY